MSPFPSPHYPSSRASATPQPALFQTDPKLGVFDPTIQRLGSCHRARTPRWACQHESQQTKEEEGHTCKHCLYGP
jgi:hypothetical protein